MPTQSTPISKSWIKTVVLVISIGLNVVGLIMYFQGHKVKSGWYSLQTEGKGVGFATEALFGVDIPLPEIKQVGGKAKFLPQNGTSSFQLGYQVNLPVATLDPKTIPAKYQIGKPLPGGLLTAPLTQVTYAATLKFQLKDGDGFTLQKLESDPIFIQSNSSNSLQGIAIPTVPSSIASRVKMVQVGLLVRKCESCESSQ